MLALLLLPGPASGAERPPPAPRPVERLAFGSALLDGDLRVVVLHHPSWSTVSIATLIDGGLADEPEPGLATALADAWLGSRPGGLSVQDAYTRLGAVAEVRVEPDVTAFWTHGPASAAPSLLALERQRLADPLARAADPARPRGESRPRLHQDGRWLAPVYDTLYPEGHPYHGIWRAPDPAGYPLYAAQALARRTWTPARTTMVVAGPMAPAEVVCALEPERCGDPSDLQTVEATLALPAPVPGAHRPGQQPVPRYPDVGPLPGPVDEPVAVLAWSLPGRAGAGDGLGVDAFAASWVEAVLREELGGRRLARCRIRDGEVNRTLVCITPDVDPARVRRRLARGWPARGLEEAIERHRGEAMAALLGATDDPEHARRLADQIHAGAEPSVHAGGLEALAYDRADVDVFLDEVLSEERLVIVRYHP